MLITKVETGATVSDSEADGSQHGQGETSARRRKRRRRAAEGVVLSPLLGLRDAVVVPPGNAFDQELAALPKADVVPCPVASWLSDNEVALKAPSTQSKTGGVTPSQGVQDTSANVLVDSLEMCDDRWQGKQTDEVSTSVEADLQNTEDVAGEGLKDRWTEDNEGGGIKRSASDDGDTRLVDTPSSSWDSPGATVAASESVTAGMDDRRHSWGSAPDVFTFIGSPSSLYQSGGRGRHSRSQPRAGAAAGMGAGLAENARRVRSRSLSRARQVSRGHGYRRWVLEQTHDHDGVTAQAYLRHPLLDFPATPRYRRLGLYHDPARSLDDSMSQLVAGRARSGCSDRSGLAGRAYDWGPRYDFTRAESPPHSHGLSVPEVFSQGESELMADTGTSPAPEPTAEAQENQRDSSRLSERASYLSRHAEAGLGGRVMPRTQSARSPQQHETNGARELGGMRRATSERSMVLAMGVGGDRERVAPHHAEVSQHKASLAPPSSTSVLPPSSPKGGLGSIVPMGTRLPSARIRSQPSSPMRQPSVKTPPVAGWASPDVGGLSHSPGLDPATSAIAPSGRPPLSPRPLPVSRSAAIPPLRGNAAGGSREQGLRAAHDGYATEGYSRTLEGLIGYRGDSRDTAAAGGRPRSAASMRTSRVNGYMGDMTHTQRGGLLMHHPRASMRRAGDLGTTAEDDYPGRREREHARELEREESHLEMLELLERAHREELRERVHLGPHTHREMALMNELRLQQEENGKLRETVQRLTMELGMCTMVVQDLSSLIKGGLPGSPAASAIGAKTSPAGPSASMSPCETTTTPSDATLELPAVELTDKTVATGGARDEHMASAALSASPHSPQGTGLLQAEWPMSEDRAGTEVAPLVSHSQAWASMTFTLQTLGRELMHAMLDQDMACFVRNTRARVAKLHKYRAAALHKVQTSAAALWPRAQCKIFGSVATGLSGPASDLDIIVCLPKVMSRESEPSLARAGVMQGRHVIKATLQANLAAFLQNSDWVQADSLRTIESSLVPVIQLTTRHLTPLDGLDIPPPIAEDLPGGAGTGKDGSAGEADGEGCVKLDVTFEGPNHQGLAGVSLVLELLQDFPALEPVFLVVKQILSEKNLDNPYTGGLSSFGLVLLITRYLQHCNALAVRLGAAAGLGELLAGFLDFVGNQFDPRETGITIGTYAAGRLLGQRRTGGSFLRRELPLQQQTPAPSNEADKATVIEGGAGTCEFQRSTSSVANRRSSNDDALSPRGAGKGDALAQDRYYRLDPLYIENPLAPMTNVTRNCFRIHRIQHTLAQSLVNLRNAVLAVPPGTLQQGGSRPSTDAPPAGKAPTGGQGHPRILHAIIACPSHPSDP